MGHAYSALYAFDLARAHDGECLLRIEDTDTERSTPAWEAQIYDDLQWLGMTWPEPVLRQSDNAKTYDRAMSRLMTLGVIYPCTCTRGDIRAALSAPQEGVINPTIYPGTCRDKPLENHHKNPALRLDMTKALELVSHDICFQETGAAHQGLHENGHMYLRKNIGDAVLGRKDIGTASYVLAAVIDDAAQGITDVVRGLDLFEFTYLQVLLQRLLDLPTPRYHHHRLIRDENGKRLAKRDDARAIAKYRSDGITPKAIRDMIDLPDI